MSTEQKQPIEIVPWVYFNDPRTKEDVTKMAENAESLMSFASNIRDKYKLSISDAMIVAKKFINKQ